MELIDTHCHLDYDFAPKTQAEIVKEALDAGVSQLITIATDVPSLEKMAKISALYPMVFHTLGIHPHDSKTLEDSHLEQIKKAATHPRCLGIGEIGLDYHYDHSPREVQKTVLKKQLDLALEVRLPIVIHSRDAEEDLLILLSAYVRGLPKGAVPGVIHCFTGTKGFGEACLALGFYISFSGILTFKKAEDLHKAAHAFPLERLVVETDAPFLAPIPFRGQKCEPSMVKLTAQKLAEIKGVSLTEVARVTTENAKRLFGLG